MGNNINRERDEELLPILYVGYSITGRMLGEDKLRKVFKRYGKFKYVKCHKSDRHTGLRSYALVEYEDLNSAKYARKKMYINDKSGGRRKRIGDWKLEICLLLKGK